MLKHANSSEALLLQLTDLLSEGEPEETLQQVCEVMGRYFNCARVGFGHLLGESDVFDYRVCWTDGTVPPLLGRFPAQAFGVQIVAKLARGETVVVDDLFRDEISSETATRATAAEVDTRAILVVPFLWAGHLRTIVYLNNRTPRAWLRSDVDLVEDIARRTRRIIELADARRERQDTLERLRFLDSLGREVSKLSHADEILAVTTRMLGEHLQLSVCAYADMDADEDGFTIRGDWAAPGSRTIVGHYSLADFGTLAVQSLSAGRPLVVNDNLQELAPREAATFQAIGITATICMPLVKDGHLRALMAVHHKGPHQWAESEISLVREVTERSWAHVERAASEAELRESEARLEIATAAAELGIWDWDLATDRIEYSPRAREIRGFAPDSEITYAMVRDLVHPDDYRFTSEQAKRALDPSVREQRPYEYRLIRPDGSVRWVIAHGTAVFSGDGPDARPLRYVGTIQDVTETKRLQDAERAASHSLRLAMDAGRMAAWETDLIADTLVGSPELNRILGFAEDAKPSMRDVRAAYYPGEDERLREIGAAAAARGERFFEAEFRYVWPSGEIRWLMLRCELQFQDGRPAKAVGVVTDVTARREVEEHRELLVAELSHRVKNTLATVLSIEKQSFGKSASLEEGRRSFQDRIHALARTHTRLAEENWIGVSLRTVLDDVLRPYRQDDGSNIAIAGPSLTLNSKAALTLGMAFHELATNAAKYGALSVKTGRLDISWATAGGTLQLKWRELSGPAVRAPTRNGFGTLLIERGVASDLRGDARLEFEPAGLICAMALPIETLRAGDAARAANSR